MPTIPNADALISAYPNGEADAVKKQIGGAVNADWITNTCTVRMSRSFNYSGSPIPGTGEYGLNTVKGGDKLRYAYRVAEFRKWMLNKYGPPTISMKSGPYGTAPAAFAGKKGIICFNDCGWSDATGHFDLWDGEKCVHQGYFERAKELYLWESRPAAAAQKTGKTTSQVNVRGGPSTSAAILGSLPANTVVNIIGTAQNNFYNIGNGQYVSATYVKLL